MIRTAFNQFKIYENATWMAVPNHYWKSNEQKQTRFFICDSATRWHCPMWLELLSCPSESSLWEGVTLKKRYGITIILLHFGLSRFWKHCKIHSKLSMISFSYLKKWGVTLWQALKQRIHVWIQFCVSLALLGMWTSCSSYVSCRSLFVPKSSCSRKPDLTKADHSLPAFVFFRERADCT